MVTDRRGLICELEYCLRIGSEAFYDRFPTGSWSRCLSAGVEQRTRRRRQLWVAQGREGCTAMRAARAGNSIGWRIRAIRERKELTGRDVASVLGISRPYYTQLEGGKRRLSAEHVWRIALALDVRVGQLFGEE